MCGSFVTTLGTPFQENPVVPPFRISQVLFFGDFPEINDNQ